MSGPVTYEMAFALIGAFALIMGAIAGLWWRIETRIASGASSANAAASLASAQGLLAQQQLADFKVLVAENYIRRHDLREMRDEIIDRLDRMEGRLDRFTGGPTPRRSS